MKFDEAIRRMNKDQARYDKRREETEREAIAKEAAKTQPTRDQLISWFIFHWLDRCGMPIAPQAVEAFYGELNKLDSLALHQVLYKDYKEFREQFEAPVETF